jgi:PAS domain S-box-containing protein
MSVFASGKLPESPQEDGLSPDSFGESAARLRVATRAGRIGIWDIDLQAGILKGSVMYRGSSWNDRIPFTWDGLEQVVHPDDRERWRQTMEAALAHGSEYDSEYRVIRLDGTIIWLHVRGQIIRRPDGTPQRLVGVSLDVTERRQAEARLALNEASLRLATDAAAIGVWEWDLISDTLTLDDRTRSMFGISPDAAVSMADCYACLHPDDYAATTAAFEAAVDPARRATYDMHYRTIGKEDGLVRWVAARGRGLFENGVCRRAVGTAIDITDRKAAEMRREFLLDLLERLRALTDPAAIMAASGLALGRHLGVSRVGYGQIQADGETILLNTCHADGVPPLSGAFPLDRFGPVSVAQYRAGQTVVCDDASLDPNRAADVLAAIDIRAFVAVPLIRDGRLRCTLFVSHPGVRRWDRADVSLIEDVAGRLWDALQRAHAEAALRETNDRLERLVAERTAALLANQARLRTVFQTSFLAQGLLTVDGTLLDANLTALEAIQARLEDVAGKPFWETPWFTGTRGLPGIVRAAVSAAAQGESVRREITVQLPSGTRSYDFSLRPVRDASGVVVALVPEAVDITDRRATEEALRQAQKMEAIGQLTGGIAHDFNNLLTGIAGSLELIDKRVAAGRTEGLSRFTAAAQTSAQRAAALTQRLLAFARRQPLDPKRVDGNRLLAEMEDLLRRTLGPAIALEMVLNGGLWPTLCDPNQLESAILNLAINARDAMPRGGRLTIETSNANLDDAYARAVAGEVKAGPYVLISVTDTGVGMPPDVIERAFDPFFTTKPAGQGTGLGLSMLYGFVKQSDGHVRVRSEPGHGTTFNVYLPRFGDGVGDQAAEPARTSEPGETVLVVDDEAAVRMLITETLDELGYTAAEAADGTSALGILQSNARIDLLVTDVGLPGLNGRQLAEAARAARPGLRVLFVTGYAHNAAIGNGGALAPGMEIITKPFSLAALAAKIRMMIEGA